MLGLPKTNGHFSACYASEQEQCNCLKKGYGLISIVVVLGFVTELLLGYKADSHSLMSDAFHVLSDGAVIGIAYWGIISRHDPKNDKRVASLERLMPRVILVVGGLIIARSSVELIWFRGSIGYHFDPGITFVVGVLGALMNLWMLAMLHRLQGGESVNTESNLHWGAIVHVSGDFFGSVGATCIAVGVLLYGWPAYSDRFVAIGIGVFLIVLVCLKHSHEGHSHPH